MKPFDDVRGAPGGQHGDQQGAHHPDHQRPRRFPPTSRCRPACPATTRTTRATPSIPPKAKALLTDAGLADGFETELYVMQHRPQPAHRPGDPAGSGRRSASRRRSSRSPRPTSSPPAATPKTAPMIWSGGMAWIADFPDPSNFYGPILGCGGAVKGGWNWSWYCNKDLEAEAAEGRRHDRPGQAGRRATSCGSRSSSRSWTTRRGRRSSTSSATRCTSARIGGEPALFNDPVHIPINYDNVYATDAQ